MTTNSRRLIPVIAFAAFLLGAASGANPPAKTITWKKDFKKALTLAKKQKKMIMLDFYADW